MKTLNELIVELMKGKGQEHLNKNNVRDYIDTYEYNIRNVVIAEVNREWNKAIDNLLKVSKK